MAKWRAGALLLALAVGGCATGSTHGGVSVGASPVRAGGPLQALSGAGSTLAPSPGGGVRRTTSYTFGTVVCSEDADADIVIDRVRYESTPALPTTEDSQASKPAIGTWLREIPPPTPGVKAILPVAGVEGGAEDLPGEVTLIGDGYRLPVEHTCDGYSASDRTWPITELLTVVTADSRGAVATKTVIEYHEGNNRYTRTIDWKVGICGTQAPRGLGCGHPH